MYDEATSSSSLPPRGLQPQGVKMRREAEDFMSQDWVEEYNNCARWSDIFAELDYLDGEPWPQGILLRNGKLYEDDRMCVPKSKVKRLIRLQHAMAGHPGGERLWAQLNRWYAFPDKGEAKAFALKVQRQCEVCQATEASKGPYKCHLAKVPIPTNIMDSVAIDLFAMPEVTYEGKPYDTLVVCVERISCWMVATPHL